METMRLACDGQPVIRPQRPWSVAMRWHDVLFMHWPVDVGLLRELVPIDLTVETFDGAAWIGVVPFHMSAIRHRFIPPLPGLSAFPELNVRTYVTYGETPGVWFFSLDAGNTLAVQMARRTYYLPYYKAQMEVEEVDAEIRYFSRRAHLDSRHADFVGRYQSTGAVYRTEYGNLDHWLTARYCLYAQDRAGRIWRGDIDHEPWSLSPASAVVETNTMTNPLGISLPDETPLLHFAKRLDVVAWSIRRVD